jgi:acyl-CoA dehydrogenase
MGLVDGPSEVHKFTIAKQVLKNYQPHADGWPSQFRPRRLVAARHRFEEMVEQRFEDPGTRSSFGSMLQHSEVPDDLFREMEDYLDAILGANL